ncbi:hypothetical protein [Sorangium sp. So ce131]
MDEGIAVERILRQVYPVQVHADHLRRSQRPRGRRSAWSVASYPA